MSEDSILEQIVDKEIKKNSAILPPTIYNRIGLLGLVYVSARSLRFIHSTPLLCALPICVYAHDNQNIALSVLAIGLAGSIALAGYSMDKFSTMFKNSRSIKEFYSAHTLEFGNNKRYKTLRASYNKARPILQNRYNIL